MGGGLACPLSGHAAGQSQGYYGARATYINITCTYICSCVPIRMRACTSARVYTRMRARENLTVGPRVAVWSVGKLFGPRL